MSEYYSTKKIDNNKNRNNDEINDLYKEDDNEIDEIDNKDNDFKEMLRKMFRSALRT